MAVLEMMYDALDYTEQVRRIEEAHKRAGDRLEGAEFLSHFTKDDRVMPVITLSLYYGNQAWDGPTSLYEMMGIDGGYQPGKALLVEQKRLLKLLENKEEEEIDMCQAIDDLIADGELRGERRGEIRGEIRREQKGHSLIKLSFRQ